MKLLNMFGKTRLEEASLEELELVLNTIEGNVGGFKRGLKAFQEKAMAIQQRKLKKRLESKRMI